MLHDFCRISKCISVNGITTTLSVTRPGTMTSGTQRSFSVIVNCRNRLVADLPRVARDRAENPGKPPQAERIRGAKKERTSLPDAKQTLLSQALKLSSSQAPLGKLRRQTSAIWGAVSAAAAMACSRGACVWNHARLGRHFVMTAMNRSSAVKRAPRNQGAPAGASIISQSRRA